MNSIDFIIKYKLWTLAKQTDVYDLEQTIENYVYNKANLDMLEDIKTEELLEKYFVRLINTEHEYKHEKKMFRYLLEQINPEKINLIKTKYSDEYLLLQWTKRNRNNLNIEFLNLLHPDILTNGTFLYYALNGSEKLIEYAININISSTYKLTESIENDLLVSRQIKGKLKIKLLNKFIQVVKQNPHYYFLDNVENNDETTALWFVDNFKKQLDLSSDKAYNFLRCSYNAVMEKIAQDHFDIIFDRDNQIFVSNFFEKIMHYKKQDSLDNLSINAIEQTINTLERYNLKLNQIESNSIFCKIVTVENIDFLMCPNNVFNINKKHICIESLLYKLLHNNNPENIINQEKLKSAIDKISEHNFSHFDRGSNALFLEYAQLDNVQWLFSHKLFSYNIEKLLPAVWSKNTILAVELAKLIDKKLVWQFVESLEKKERVMFEVNYYNDKFVEKQNVKRLKI